MLLAVHGLFVLEGRSWRFQPNMVLTHGQTSICCKVQRKSIGRGQLIILVFFVHQLKETVKVRQNGQQKTCNLFCNIAAKQAAKRVE